MHVSTQNKIKPMSVKTTPKGPRQRAKKKQIFQKLRGYLFISLSYWMNGFCLGFVIWQTIKCMTKYVEKPKGTEISMKQSANVPFPAITVCGIFGKDEISGLDMKFNETYLQNVCGIR